MRFRPAVALVLAGLASTTLVPLAATAAPPAPAIDGPTTVTESADFATDRFGDPWDFANPLDVQLDNSGPVMPSSARASLRDGRLVLHAPDGVLIALVWPGFRGALPTGRDGQRAPVPAAGYTHAAVRLRAPSPGPVGLLWSNCPAADASCQGGAGLNVPTGWGTYVIPLAGEPHWSGAITALRFQTGAPGGDQTYELDWVRLFTPSGGVRVTAEDGATVYWDDDASLADNAPGAPGWGEVGTASKGRVDFPADAYPPGTYRFYAVDGSGTSAHSEPLTIDAVPRTIITDPDETGGEDYAAAVRGDPWDFGQPSDVRELQNIQKVEWSGGQLHASNGPPQTSNPIVKLAMGPALDPARYHRLTVRTSYDGPFSLAFSCGGGMHGRLRWFHGGEMHVSKELVTYTDRHTYTVDLATSPPERINEEENYARDHGWAGAPVTDVWWDANEDPCERRFHVDEVRIAADDEAKGFFGVRWTDQAHQDGTTVSLHRDTDAGGFDGPAIATDLPQRAGDNVHWWSTYGVPAGTYWLWSQASDGVNAPRRRYATGPVVVDGRPRVAGPDRLTTAIATSRLSFPSADAAVVAYGFDFPDALAAAALASAAQGPLLLNHRDRLDAGVQAELERLGVATVYLLGGQAAQSTAVEEALAALDGVEVVRVGGGDRYETAALAASEAARVWRDAGHAEAGEQALVAVATSFADALAAGQLAGHARRPLLLVRRDALHPVTASALEDLGTTGVTLVGGTAALTEDVRRDLEEAGYDVDRIGGADRYHTAALVADAAVAAGADRHRVAVASGTAFADALATGPSAVADGGTLLLTHPARLPDHTLRALRAAAPATLLKVAGGAAAIADATVDAIAAEAS